MNRTRFRTAAALAAGALILAPLAACGGDDGKKPAASTQADGAVDTADFFAGLLSAMDEHQSVHMTIEGGFAADADLAYGGAQPAARLTASLGAGKVQILVVGGALYMQQSTGGKFTKIGKDDPTFGSLLDTFNDFGPRQSVAGIQDGVSKVVAKGTEKFDGTELQRYDVTADTGKATGAFKALVGSGGGSEKITMRFYVDDDQLLHGIKLDVSGQELAMTLSDWGKPVTITAPKPNELLNNTAG